MSLGNIQSVKPTILGSKERWVEREERRAGDKKGEKREREVERRRRRKRR